MTTDYELPPDPHSQQAPVFGPSGLSDYEVSPLGMPIALLGKEVRVAFLGRTSTDDQQDPRNSMIRQLGNSKHALPDSWVIVAHFYDVESGRMDLDLRGHGTGYERFGIPIARDGGIADLMDEARHPDRRFDVVICEGVSRIARLTFEGLSIERELQNAEVPLFAANEPITLSGSRAQRILQRRINQSVAEYELLNILEQSWGGLCTHIRDGYNIGKPPHGYRAKIIRHPNPAKADHGHTKMRLEPDGTKAETVTQIAMWRYYEGLGYDTITDRLNANLTKYPPPTPAGPHRARGAWGKSTVYDILRNPKYTGFQVFNRRASRSGHGKVNDPAKWVWSTEPVHEPLIPKWMYDELNTGWLTKRATRKHRATREHNEPFNHPQTLRTYLYRGMIHHGCGRRMQGHSGRKTPYYQCSPRANNRGRPDKLADHHPKAYINERAITQAVTSFYSERIFGPHRRELLAHELSGIDQRAAHRRQTERERLERAITDTQRKQQSLLRQAQDGDPSDPFAKALRSNYNDLEAHKNQLQATITNLDNAHDLEPALPSTEDIALLDALPYLLDHITEAPEPLLRRLFEITRLKVQLNDDTDNQINITIHLPADQLNAITAAAHDLAEHTNQTHKTPAQRKKDNMATNPDSVQILSEPRRGHLKIPGQRHFTESLTWDYSLVGCLLIPANVRCLPPLVARLLHDRTTLLPGDFPSPASSYRPLELKEG